MIKNQTKGIIPFNKWRTETKLPMQARREIIREASRGYNELSKKEKMARFDPISRDPKTESTTTVYNWTILVDISPT